MLVGSALDFKQIVLFDEVARSLPLRFVTSQRAARPCVELQQSFGIARPTLTKEYTDVSVWL